MPRTPRIRLAGIPMHVTHRGNQRRQVFFEDRDYREYLDLLDKYARMFEMLVWAYCHHFCAGIRFLLLDLHIGIEKEAARKSAGIVFAVSIPLTLLLLGVLL